MDRSIIAKVLQVSNFVQVRVSRLVRSCSKAETLRLKLLLQQKRVTTYNHIHQRLVCPSCVPEKVGTKKNDILYEKNKKGLGINGKPAKEQ
jgi:hypothetical protein